MDATWALAAAAIARGELLALAALLEQTPGLARHRQPCGHPTLLQLVACEERSLPDPHGAASLLVDHGAEMAPPLVAAAGCGSTGTLRLLLARGCPTDGPEWSALDEALYWAQHATVAILAEAGASVHRLRTAAGLGADLAAFFAGEGLAPHAGPIASPFADTVPAELAEDPQAVLDHAFVMAVNCGQRGSAEVLWRRGARINSTPPGFHWRGTALHAACWRGDEAMVRWLLSLGADPSLRDGHAHADAAGWARHHGHTHLLAALGA